MKWEGLSRYLAILLIRAKVVKLLLRILDYYLTVFVILFIVPLQQVTQKRKMLSNDVDHPDGQEVGGGGGSCEWVVGKSDSKENPKSNLDLNLGLSKGYTGTKKVYRMILTKENEAESNKLPVCEEGGHRYLLNQ